MSQRTRQEEKISPFPLIDSFGSEDFDDSEVCRNIFEALVWQIWSHLEFLNHFATSSASLTRQGLVRPSTVVGLTVESMVQISHTVRLLNGFTPLLPLQRKLEHPKLPVIYSTLRPTTKQHTCISLFLLLEIRAELFVTSLAPSYRVHLCTCDFVAFTTCFYY